MTIRPACVYRNIYLWSFLSDITLFVNRFAREMRNRSLFQDGCDAHVVVMKAARKTLNAPARHPSPKGPPRPLYILWRGHVHDSKSDPDAGRGLGPHCSRSFPSSRRRQDGRRRPMMGASAMTDTENRPNEPRKLTDEELSAVSSGYAGTRDRSPSPSRDLGVDLSPMYRVPSRTRIPGHLSPSPGAPRDDRGENARRIGPESSEGSRHEGR